MLSNTSVAGPPHYSMAFDWPDQERGAGGIRFASLPPAVRFFHPRCWFVLAVFGFLADRLYVPESMLLSKLQLRCFCTGYSQYTRRKALAVNGCWIFSTAQVGISSNLCICTCIDNNPVSSEFVNLHLLQRRTRRPCCAAIAFAC